MLIPRAALTELEAALRAPRGGLRTAAVELDVDPLELVRAGAGVFGSAVFFAGPAGQAVGGLGVAWSVEAAGPERFGLLDGDLRGALPDAMGAVLGFAFNPGGPCSPEWDGFPAATAVVPQLAVWQRDGSSRLCVAVPAGASPAGVLAAAGMLRRPGPPEVPPGVGPPHPLPPVAEWVGRVREAVAAIRSGTPAKVVLARAQRVVLERAADAFDLVAVLRDRCPGCYAYGWQAGPAALVGASPELLVSRAGERFAARPLAGSARRGADPEEDRRLGDRLLTDPKEQAEHAFVAEEVASRLAPF
ncbi:MAG TPA: chorismate-binding protein, partial [Acidimicrobiia bacterium]|nr:chorismate-binding protein [Acidimicrobiia bacterium]